MVSPNKSILFKPEYSNTLLNISIGDLETANSLLTSSRPHLPISAEELNSAYQAALLVIDWAKLQIA